MDAFKKSADEASKTIGEGLVDALVILSEDNTIENLSDDMEDFATAIADTIRGIAKLTKKIQEIPGVNKIFTLEGIPVLGSYLEAFRKSGAQSRVRELPDNAKRSASRIELKSIKDSAKFRRLENDQLKKKTDLDKLKEKFDLELIGLNKALLEATDQETKARLNGLIAIAKNDEALAKTALAELEAAEAAQQFAKNFNIALEAIRSMTDKINQFINSQVVSFDDALESIRSLNARIATMIAKIGGPTSGRSGGGGGPGDPVFDYALSEIQAKNEAIKSFEYNLGLESTRELNARINEFVAQRTSTQAPTEIRVTVDAGGDRLSQAIAESIQVANRSGYSTVPAGFIV
jgi:hypothetical protein